MIFKHIVYGSKYTEENSMCFWKCGFLTFNIMCATKNIKLNVRKPCLNERTSKQFFTEITKGDIKIIQFS